MGHRQLYGNLKLDKKNPLGKEERDVEGAINTRKGCWEVKKVFVTCRTMKRRRGGADVILSRVLVEEDKRK